MPGCLDWDRGRFLEIPSSFDCSLPSSLKFEQRTQLIRHKMAVLLNRY